MKESLIIQVSYTCSFLDLGKIFMQRVQSD